MNYYLPKPDYIRRGTAVCGSKQLTQEVIDYCARDAEAPLRLYHKYKDIQNCRIQICKGEIMQVGTKCHIMPQGRTPGLKPIAKGTIVKVEGKGPCNTELSNTSKVLLRVHEVYEENAIVHHPIVSNHKCKCNRALLSTWCATRHL